MQFLDDGTLPNGEWREWWWSGGARLDNGGRAGARLRLDRQDYGRSLATFCDLSTAILTLSPFVIDHLLALRTIVEDRFLIFQITTAISANIGFPLY
jgi:hypothetical protein